MIVRPSFIGRVLIGRVLVGTALLGMACAPLPEPPSTQARATPVAEPPERFRPVVAVGQGLELPLPDADGWRRDARETHSWVATHAATRSRLVARSWRADVISTVAACERQMRTWRPDLPLLPSEARLETRAPRIGNDVTAELWVGVDEPADEPKALAGLAQLVASDGRRCTIVAYETRAEGPDRTRLIGGRLAAIAHALERVRQFDISERVQTKSR